MMLMKIGREMDGVGRYDESCCKGRLLGHRQAAAAAGVVPTAKRLGQTSDKKSASNHPSFPAHLSVTEQANPIQSPIRISPESW